MIDNNSLKSDSYIKEPDLVLLLKSGNSKGFAYLYENYGRALFVEIKNIVIDHDIAADVLQELFINIYRKIGIYDSSKGKLYTWMVAMARNLAIDTSLSKAYRNRRNNIHLSLANENPSPSTATKIDNIDLHNHIKKIAARYWDVLYLKYFQGHTHEEISHLLELPLGTVKTRIKAGLVRLRKLMNE
jgi:RNA polymerase sigma factor (sigma-70 family)